MFDRTEPKEDSHRNVRDVLSARGGPGCAIPFARGLSTVPAVRSSQCCCCFLHLLCLLWQGTGTSNVGFCNMENPRLRGRALSSIPVFVGQSLGDPLRCSNMKVHSRALLRCFYVHRQPPKWKRPDYVPRRRDCANGCANKRRTGIVIDRNFGKRQLSAPA